MADTPVRSGYVEGIVAWRPQAGLVGRVEAGVKPIPGLSLYGFGQADRWGPQAGAGARYEVRF